jgi:hypothetical protein
VIVAALALTTTAKAGLIGTGQASYCDPTSTQVFAPWGDSSYYATLLNGGFEGGSTGWTLSGGARVVSGNEPFLVGHAGDSHSLLLPAGSSVYSGTVCFALGDWHMRLFAKNVGAASGRLHVQVVVPSLLGGLLTILDGGSIGANGSWVMNAVASYASNPLLLNVRTVTGDRAVTNALVARSTLIQLGAAYALLDRFELGAHLPLGRGMVKLKKGDDAGGNADIMLAKAIQANITEVFGKYDIQP